MGRQGVRRFFPSFLTLDRYIITQTANAFVFGVLAFTVLLVAGDLLFEIADLMIERGVSLWAVSRLFLYKLPGVVVMTLPMASLLAALLTFGRLSSQSEIIAMKAAGIAFQRILRPVIAASVLVSIFAIIMNESIVPLSNKAADNIFRFEVAREQPSLLKEQIFLRDEQGGQLRRVIYIAKLLQNRGEMQDILIQDFEEGVLSRITNAEKAYWKDGRWFLERGKTFEVARNGKVNLLFSFDTQEMPRLLEPGKIARASRDPDEMSALELREYIGIMEKQGANTDPLLVMFHLKLSLPWACVILALLGSSLGVRPHRTGSGVGLAVSVMVVFVYYVLMSFFKSFGEAGYLPPLVAAWMPNVVFFAYALRLAFRANR
ncbi:MAG: LPS export ABC transporter permease LptG [Thermovirgaceae bacterium]